MQAPQEKQYSDLRNELEILLQNNPPPKAIDNSLHRLCKSKLHFFPQIPETEERENEIIPFLKDLIAFYAVYVELKKALDEYLSNQSDETKSTLQNANLKFIQQYKSFYQSHKTEIDKSSNNIKYERLFALLFVASYISLIPTLIIGCGLYSIIPAAVLVTSLLILSSLHDSKSAELSCTRNSVAATYNSMYKANTDVFKSLGDDSLSGAANKL